MFPLTSVHSQPPHQGPPLATETCLQPVGMAQVGGDNPAELVPPVYHVIWDEELALLSQGPGEVAVVRTILDLLIEGCEQCLCTFKNWGQPEVSKL